MRASRSAPFLVGVAGVTIEGFTIRNARTLMTDLGDGIRVLAAGSNVIIRKCTIVQSQVGGIALGALAGAVTVFAGSELVVRDCSMKDGGAEGEPGVLVDTVATFTLEKLNISGFGDGTTQATKCVVTKNRIDIANDGTLNLTSCTFTTGSTATLPQID